MNRLNPIARDRHANVIVLALALILTATLAKDYFSPRGPEKKPLAGTRLAVRGVDWEAAEQTLLIILDEDCLYCEQSMPFYWQLAEMTAGRSDVRLIGVIETDEAAGRRYLEANGVHFEVIRWLFRLSGIFQTPNLILVNREGEVTKQWVGLLSPSGEADVIRWLLGKGAAGGAEVGKPGSVPQSPSVLQGGRHGIAASELPHLMKERRVTFIDLDGREIYAAEHIAGAKNIPADELYIRALNELDNGATIVLHTRNYNRYVLGNVQVLKRQGFESVKVLKGGLDGWKGAGLPTTAGRGAKEAARQ